MIWVNKKREDNRVDTLIISNELNAQPTEGATKSTIEFIRNIEGEKIFINISKEKFTLDDTKIIHFPLIKPKKFSYLIYILVTVLYSFKIKPYKLYYFPLCFPNTFPGIIFQLHAYILSRISKDFTEFLYQTNEPTRLFRLFSKFNICVTSKESLKNFKNHGLHVSYSPIVYQKSKKEYNREKLRKTYGFKQGDFIVLHVGHLEENRGLDVLTELSKLMCDTNILIVLSSKRTKNGFDLERENLKIIDKYIDDIYEIYAMSDVYVFPIKCKSSSIDTPLSILEAKEMGLPIITSNLKSIREILVEYPKSYFVNQNSPEEMAKEIKKYIKLIRGT